MAKVSADRPAGATRRPASPTAEGAMVAIAFFVFYLLTRTRDFGGDDTVFALAVDRWLQGFPDWRVLAHPYHPFYNLMTGLVCRVLEAFGVHHPYVLDVGAGVSAFAAALVVGGLVVILRRARVRESVALLTAVAAGFSGGLWEFATRMEVYAMLAVAVLLWLDRTGRDDAAPVGAGLALAAAVLAHLAAGLLSLPTAWRFRRRPGAALRALVVGLGAAGTVLLLLFASLDRATSVVNIRNLVVPSSAGTYLRGPQILPIFHGLHGLAVSGWGNADRFFNAGVLSWLRLAGWIAVAVLVLLIGAGIAESIRCRRRHGLMAIGGILAFLPLWMVWDVGNVEHMVATVPLFAVLAGLGASTLPRRGGEMALTIAVLALFTVNGIGSILPRTRADSSRVCVVASFVNRTVGEDAVVLAVGRDPRLRLGLPYLSGRRVRALSLYLEGARRRGLAPERGVAAWLAPALRSREVWAFGDVFDPASSRWLEDRGLDPAVWRRVRASLAPVGERSLAADGVALRRRCVLYRVAIGRPGEEPGR